MPAGDSLGEFFVSVALDPSKFEKGLAGIRGTIGQFVAQEFVDVVKKAADAEKSMIRMNAALKAIGGDVGKFDQLSDTLSRAFAVDDESIKDMITLAANLGATKDEIPEVVKAAMGLSEVFGTDMKASIDDVIKSQNGNFLSLTRLIPQLKNAATNEEKLAMVMKISAQGLRQREQVANGLAGGMDQIKIAAEELKEAIGGLIAVPLAQFFRDAADALRTFTPGTEEAARAVMTLTQHYLRLIRTWRQFKGDQAGAAKAQAEIDELEQRVQDSIAKSVQQQNEARNKGTALQNKAAEKTKEHRKEVEKLRHAFEGLEEHWRNAQEGILNGTARRMPGKGGDMGNPLVDLKRGGGGGGPVDVKMEKTGRIIELLGKIYDAARTGIPGRFAQ